MSEEYDDIDEETLFEDDEEFADIGEISEGLLLASDVLPEHIPIIPLRPRPAFPNILIPMSISGKEKVEIIKKAAESQSHTIGMVLVRNIDGKDEPDNLHRIGVVGKIVKILKNEEENIQVLVNCLERFTIKHLHETDDGLVGSVEYLKSPEDAQREELKAYSMAIITTLKELVQINPLYSEEIKMFLGRSSMDDPGKLADFAANLTSADGQELQKVLETFDVHERIDQVLILLKKELEVSRLQSKISKQIEKKCHPSSASSSCANSLKRSRKSSAWKKRGKPVK